MGKIRLEADIANWEDVRQFLIAENRKAGVEQYVNACEELCLICEEFFTNVASYAYPKDKKGYVTVIYEIENEIVRLCIKDEGTAFNPLEHRMPDVSLPLEARHIGGLGVFMGIKLSDDLKYEYVNNQNCLTIYKKMKTD